MFAGALLFETVFAGRLEAQTKTSDSIPITLPRSDETVDFNRAILPLLKRGCLACHNRTAAKGDLTLETPADIRKGGESGPAVVPGNPADSLLLRLASHQAKPRMPPRDNRVNAQDLTSEELGLLARWIEQGSHGSSVQDDIISWQTLAPNLQGSFAAAVSRDGKYAACGRGNQIHLYHVPTRKLIARLSDPSLGERVPAATSSIASATNVQRRLSSISNEPPSSNLPAFVATNGFTAAPAAAPPISPPIAPIAHRDIVNSLSFNTDGSLLASGGYREAKIWKRVPIQTASIPLSRPAAERRVNSPDGKLTVALDDSGNAFLFDKATNRFIAQLGPEYFAVRERRLHDREVGLARAEREHALQRHQAAQKTLRDARERLSKAITNHAAAMRVTHEKRAFARVAQVQRDVAAIEAERLGNDKFNATNAPPALKAAREKLEAATKAGDAAKEQLQQTERKEAQAENEMQLSQRALGQAEGAWAKAEWKLQDTESLLAKTAPSATRTNIPVIIQSLAFSPDSRTVAGVNNAGGVILWTTVTGDPYDEWKSPRGKATNALFASDNHVVVIPSKGNPLDWVVGSEWVLERSLGTGGPDSSIPDRVTSIAFDPQGRRIAAGSGDPSRSGEIRFWEAHSGAALGVITNLHSDTVLGLDFSPDGWFIASGGADRFARVSDTTLLSPVRAFEGHTGHVLAVSWAPNGRTLASGGADGVVKFWDFESGERKKQATGFGKEVTGVSYAGINQVVAMSGQPLVRMLNEDGDTIREYSGATDFINSGQASPEAGLFVAGAANGDFFLWEVNSSAGRLLER